jgi:hypothetical protein
MGGNCGMLSTMPFKLLVLAAFASMTTAAAAAASNHTYASFTVPRSEAGGDGTSYAGRVDFIALMPNFSQDDCRAFCSDTPDCIGFIYSELTAWILPRLLRGY